MKRVLVICRVCGHEQPQEVLDDRELRDPRIRRGPVRCPKCGSEDVFIR
jgi:uncharacterized Zn finger protein